MRSARRHSRWLCTALAGTAAAAVAGSASADGVDVIARGEIQPGALTISPVPRRIAVTGFARTRAGWRRAVVDVPITVVDARGSGAGWALTLSAKTQTAKGHRVRGVVTSVWGMRLRCASCTRPRSHVGFPLRLSETRAVRAFAAAPGTGMGLMRVTAQIAISLPKKAPHTHYVLFPRLSQTAGP